MILEDITMKDFEDGIEKTRTVIVPLGTVEEHGTHLPLGTDTIHALETAKMTAQKAEVFVAPPIHYGVCTSTADHPGTLSISADTLRVLLDDLVHCLYSKGLRSIILLSGHAGGLHMSAMKEIAEDACRNFPDLNMAVLSVFDLITSNYKEVIETPMDSHAGEGETSGMLFLRPDLVKGRAKEEYPKRISYFITKDKLKYWPGGVWGNPEKATREKGEKLIRKAVEEMVKIVNDIKDFKG